MRTTHLAALLLLLEEKFPDEEFVNTEDAPVKPIELPFRMLDDTEVFLPSKLLTPKERSYDSPKGGRDAHRMKKYRNPILRRERRVIKQP